MLLEMQTFKALLISMTHTMLNSCGFRFVCAHADKPVQLVPVLAAGGGGLPEAAGSEGGCAGI